MSGPDAPFVAIADYGIGNLRSVAKALQNMGFDARLTGNPAELAASSGLILPGVGAFGACAAALAAAGLAEPVAAYARAALAGGRPFLGICVGMQLLFSGSEESPEAPGLGVLPGRVRRFTTAQKVPHMGWNTVHVRQAVPVLADVADGAYVYFVHSYYPAPDDPGLVATTTDYDGEFTSSVARGNLFACQFHPEKSQSVGLAILRRFGGAACS